MHFAQSVWYCLDINPAFGAQQNTLIFFGYCASITYNSIRLDDSFLIALFAFSSCGQSLIFLIISLPFDDIMASLTHFVKWNIGYLSQFTFSLALKIWSILILVLVGLALLFEVSSLR